MTEIKPGSVLGGRYTLSRQLTSGGPGPQRWAAADGTLKRDVTVVTFPTKAPTAGAAVDAARQVASTVDQRLARVLDVGEQGGLAFIVVESLEHAQTLTKLADGGKLHPEEARRIIGEAASALESARLRGLHHQVLNPGHIRVSKDGSVSVSGVATAAALGGKDDTTPAEASMIDTGRLVACLYSALTGTWPLPGPNPTPLPAAPRHADGTLKGPAEVVPNVPHDLDDLCHDVLPNGSKNEQPRDHGLATPGDVARSLAPWSADPITPDVAHLNHVAAPVPSGAAAQGGWADDWDEDAAWDEAFQEGPGFRDAAPTAQYAAADYPEEEYAEEYDERPLPPPPAPQRSRTDTRVTLALVAGFVLLAIFLAWLGLNTLQKNPWNTPKATIPTRTATKGATTSAGEAPPATKPAAPATAASTSSTTGADVKPVSVSLITPGQDGGLRGGTQLALDGDPTTYWASRAYTRTDRSDQPIGLAYNLGSSQKVSAVDVVFPGGTYSPNVYVGTSPSIDGATKIGSGDGVSGTWTATPSTPATGQYVILWFTKAGVPAKSITGDPYGVQVSEIKVHG